MKYIIASTLLLCLPQFAFANDTEKAAAYTTAISIGNSVHCEAQPYGDSSPLEGLFLLSSNDDYDKIYALLQEVDYQCYGGNATYLYVLTPVRQASFGKFVAVRDDYTNAVIDDLFEQLSNNTTFNPRFIEKVKFNSIKKQMALNSYVYDDDDHNNFPSLKYQVVIDFSKPLSPKIIKTQYLGKVRH